MWDAFFDHIRTQMADAGIDTDIVNVDLETDDACGQRYLTISGIQSYEAETMRAIVREVFVIVDPQYLPSDEVDDQDDEYLGQDPDDEEP